MHPRQNTRRPSAADAEKHADAAEAARDGNVARAMASRRPASEPYRARGRRVYFVPTWEERPLNQRAPPEDEVELVDDVPAVYVDDSSSSQSSSSDDEDDDDDDDEEQSQAEVAGDASSDEEGDEDTEEEGDAGPSVPPAVRESESESECSDTSSESESEAASSDESALQSEDEEETSSDEEEQAPKRLRRSTRVPPPREPPRDAHGTPAPLPGHITDDVEKDNYWRAHSTTAYEGGVQVRPAPPRS